MGSAQEYVERTPVAALRVLVRVVWVQWVGAKPYVQRTCRPGVLSCAVRLGRNRRLVGPLTGPSVDVLAPGSAEAALGGVQEYLVNRRIEPDLLMSEAVRRLMPWRAGEIGALSEHLAISGSQLRRRCVAAVGIRA